MQYDFEWDPAKARKNRAKHRVGFDQAAMVFRDQRAITLYDPEHSEQEERWVTMGMTPDLGVIVVHHSFLDIGPSRVRVRIFSSRKATRNEVKEYRRLS